MRIGHCQLDCLAGEYEKNIEKVLEGLQWADREKLEIVSFPESFLTGYFSSGEEARAHAFKMDGPEIETFLERTAKFQAMFMVGLNELRGEDLYNTVLVAEKGELIGTYSKAFPCYEYFTPGREFPVFTKNGVKFGIVICADGGYVEPCRILALKGARVVFAPHYNFLLKERLIPHYNRVRVNHASRAMDNHVYFLRGNNVNLTDFDPGLKKEGVGYGDSYLMDPAGEIVVRSELNRECRFCADIDFNRDAHDLYHSVKSSRELGQMVLDLAAKLDPEQCRGNLVGPATPAEESQP